MSEWGSFLDGTQIPGAGRARGDEGSLDQSMRALEDVRFGADEVSGNRSASMCSCFTPPGRGRASVVDLGQMAWMGATMFHVRDGTVASLVTYFQREHALPDLGLAE
jgi:hypothetical protein